MRTNMTISTRSGAGAAGRRRANRARRWAALPSAVLLAMTLGSCGGDAEPQQVAVAEAGDAGAEADAEEDEFGDTLAEAMGAGGGGTLIFDGQEIAIDSVVCHLTDDVIEVGTVSESGHRVLISRTQSSDTIGVQVLDADSRQWFPEAQNVDEARRDGTTFTSGPSTYWGSDIEGTIEVSFTVECP